MRAWFPCAYCPWEGDTTFRYWNDTDETILFDCPECGEENWDDLDERDCE